VIAHDLPRKSRAFGGLFQLRRDDFARRTLGGDDRQHTHIVVPQRSRREGDVAQPQAQDHANLHGPDLHRMIDQIGPIVADFEHFTQREQTQPLQPPTHRRGFGQARRGLGGSEPNAEHARHGSQRHARLHHQPMTRVNHRDRRGATRGRRAVRCQPAAGHRVFF
jgi:hypothetical protein